MLWLKDKDNILFRAHLGIKRLIESIREIALYVSEAASPVFIFKLTPMLHFHGISISKPRYENTREQEIIVA